MNTLKVGFSRVNIDPPIGIAVAGYYVPRNASRILDSIYANAVALTSGSKMIDTQVYNPDTGRYMDGRQPDPSDVVVMISVDKCGLYEEECLKFAEAIEKRTGIKAGNVFIHATHTHTGPVTKYLDENGEDTTLTDFYETVLMEALVRAAQQALLDLKPAKMGFCVGYAPERVAYIRRYKMKDGSTMTCPPIEDPNLDHAIGTLDQRVNVIRFDREGGDTVVLMNYGLHADCLNLDVISPDWPGWMSRTFETAVPGTKCVFFNGCEGDVGSTHVFPEAGDMNDTKISFDNEMKSEGMARFVGRALCGTILQVYDKVEYVDVDDVAMLVTTAKIPANVPSKEELPLAHKYKDLHEAGRDCDIPYKAMELTTVVAEAMRMCRLENGPEYFEMNLSGLKIGPVAFLGIPGEPFTDIGVQIKKAEGWKLICPTCLTGGSAGYFPMKDAYDEGGYEARSSRFKSGVAETIIENAVSTLNELKKL